MCSLRAREWQANSVTWLGVMGPWLLGTLCYVPCSFIHIVMHQRSAIPATCRAPGQKRQVHMGTKLELPCLRGVYRIISFLPPSLILTQACKVWEGLGNQKDPTQHLRKWKTKDKKVTTCKLNINPLQNITEMWTVTEGGRKCFQIWRPWL